MQKNLKNDQKANGSMNLDSDILDMFSDKGKVQKLLLKLGVTLEDIKDVTSTMNSDDMKNLKKVINILINKQQFDQEFEELYDSAYMVSEKIDFKQPGFEMFGSYNFMGSVKSVKNRNNSYEGKSDLDKINVGLVCTNQSTISAALASDETFYKDNQITKVKNGNYSNENFIVINGNFRPHSLQQQIYFIESQN